MAEVKEFTAITTQEELDKIVLERLNKAKKSEAAKYEGYLSPEDVKKLKDDHDKQVASLNDALNAAKEKTASYDKDIADRDAKIKGYETAALKSRIAHETGIPYELSGRLAGENEDEIKADAESLSKLIKAGQGAPPLKSTEPSDIRDTKRAALKNLLADMKGD